MDCPREDDLLSYVDGTLDPGPRASLDGHFASCADCRRLLAGLIDETFPSLPGSTSSGELDPGMSLGRYLVLRPIGAGGMGVVYAAYDPDLARNVALKLLRTEVVGSGEDVRARVQREAQAMARLAHPNVVSVYDVGIYGEQVFIAMELVDGQTLGAWLQQSPRSWQEILRVLVAAGRGLAAAHRAGLVHRDFKPENVLVGSDGRARVTDFGLARASNELRAIAPSGPVPIGEGLMSPLTRTGALVGSPAYMSPEQLRGEPLDARSDIFSFCVSAYEVLFGVRPFAAAAVAALLGQIEKGELLPAVRGKEVPAFVRRALVRGLSAAPAARPASIEVLLAELEPPRKLTLRAALAMGLVAVAALGLTMRAVLMARAPLCTGGPARFAHAWSPERREALARAFHASGLPLADDALRSVSAGLDSYGADWTRSYVEACEATHLRGEQSQELLDLRMACLDQRMQETQALVDLLANADARLVQRASTVTHNLIPLAGCSDLRGLRARARAPSGPGMAEKIVAVRSTLAQATAQFAIGQYEKARALSETAGQGAHQVDFAPLEGEAWYIQGWSEDHLNRYPAAERSLTSAAMLASLGGDERLAAQSLCQLVFVTGNDEDRVDDALRWYQLAEVALEGAGRPEPVVAACEQHLGSVFSQHDRAAEALPHLQAAMDMAVAAAGPDSIVVTNPMEALAVGFFQANRPGDALPLLERVLAISTRELGAEHPRVALTEINVASTLDKLDRAAEAEPHFLRGLKVLEARLGPDSSELLSGDADHARALRHLGKFELARLAASKTVDGCARVRTCEGRVLSEGLEELGAALDALGRSSEAVAPLEKSLELGISSQIAPDDLAETRFILARVLATVGREPARALELATAAHTGLAPLDPARAAAIEAWLKSHPSGR